MDEEENLIPENEKYIKKFQELIELNRKKGRDHEVLCDYLGLHDRIFSERERYRNETEIYDRIFDELERRVRERIG